MEDDDPSIHHDIHPSHGVDDALLAAAIEAAGVDDQQHQLLDEVEPLPFEEPVHAVRYPDHDHHNRHDEMSNHRKSHFEDEYYSLGSSASDQAAHTEKPRRPQQAKPFPAENHINEASYVDEPSMSDVLSGRGANVNAHPGNKRFRSLCFSRKAEFEAANLAARKRIAAEIVRTMVSREHTRFLKQTKQGWLRLSTEQAIHKAAQVMRDFRRPDRFLRDVHSTRRNKKTATPNRPNEIEALPPINEIPEELREHDVLSGRGAFVNEYPGNQHLRNLAAAKHEQFRTGSYAEKRKIAVGIVNQIKSSHPPGRFLKKPDSTDEKSPLIAGEWLQMSDEKAIAKTCQVLRDMKRPDRWERDEKRRMNKHRKQEMHRNQEHLASELAQDTRLTAETNNILSRCPNNQRVSTLSQEEVRASRNYDEPEKFNDADEELHPDIVAEAIAAVTEAELPSDEHHPM